MHEPEGIEIHPFSTSSIFQKSTRVQLEEIESSICLNCVSRREGSAVTFVAVKNWQVISPAFVLRSRTQQFRI